MKTVSGKELAKVLEANSWRLARVHGSHNVYVKEGFRERISIPIHGNRPLKKGLLSHLLKIAGIKLGDR